MKQERCRECCQGVRVGWRMRNVKDRLKSRASRVLACAGIRESGQGARFVALRGQPS